MSNQALERGQCDLDELVTIERAHDVRTLRPCAHCDGLGHKQNMIDDPRLLAMDGTDWYHGRCYVERFGGSALKKLPRAKLERLTIGDIGTRLMRALMKHLDEQS